jgi:uncharacterized protein
MISSDDRPLHRARTPNVTIDIADIIEKWSLPSSTFASEHMVAATGRASNGAISWRASTNSLTAPTLPQWYDGFEQFLEPGIRDLCLLFIRQCGWITYTSCEGHKGISAPSSLRHVGVLPRDRHEYSAIEEFLNKAVYSFRGSFPGVNDISVGILRHKLSDPFRSWDVLDIEFAPLTGQERYFAGIEAATSRLISIVKAQCSRKVGMS